MKKLLTAMLAGAVLSLAPSVGSAQTPAHVTQAKVAPVDINRAKAEELMTLKGIGEARAQAIIKGRPYTRKDELVQKKILPEAVYGDIKEQIVARH